MTKTTETKTLIVTETVRYFGRQRDPWTGADFAAVAERALEVETPRDFTDACTDGKALHAS